MTAGPPATPGAGTALRGLVVDWGGVLTPGLDDAMTRWARADGVAYDHFRDVLRLWVGHGTDHPDHTDQADHPDHRDHQDRRPPSPVHRLELGESTPDEFERELARELAERGSTVPAAGLLARMLDGLQVLDRSMIGLVRRARDEGLRTALLSNSWGEHYPSELEDGLFDAVVISGRVGMRKPEERIFRHVCDLLGLEPAECVFVDDLARNVHAAAAAGMVGVLHRSYPETLFELETLFGRSLSAAGSAGCTDPKA